MAETWWEYVSRISGGAPQADIAARVGVDASRPTGWKQGKAVNAHNAVAFARAYGRPAIEGLVAAGYLHPEEAGENVQVTASATDIPDEQLIAELRERLLERKKPIGSRNLSRDSQAGERRRASR